MSEVYLVESTYPYEGSSISGVFSTQEKAQSFIDKQKVLCTEYMEDQEKTDYCTKLESPKCLNEDMEILKCALNVVDHYRNEYKNLTLEL